MSCAIIQTSLEHMRIKAIESSEDSSDIDFDDAPIVKCSVTFAAASIVNMDMPDVEILESVKTGLP